MKKRIALALAVITLILSGVAAYSTSLHGRGAYELINWAAIRWNDTATNTVTHQRIEHSTSGTAAAGLGTGVKFYVETASGTAEHAGGLYSWWTTATGGAAASSSCLQTVSGSTAANVACWNSTGRQYKSDSSTATVTNFELSHESTGTATTGFGTGVKLYAETSSGTQEHIGGITTAWSTATGGAAVSTTCIQNVNASTAVNALCAETTGALTTASTLAVGTPTKFDYLLASTALAVSPTVIHTLYTVPSGRTAVVNRLVIRACSGTLNQATDPVISFGCNSSDWNNISVGATYTTPTSASGVVRPTILAESAVCAAAGTVKANVTTSATTLETCTVDVFGYLY